jgi:hypothetical protein
LLVVSRMKRLGPIVWSTLCLLHIDDLPLLERRLGFMALWL